MKFHVHFNPTTGEIVGHENTLEPMKQLGFDILTVDAEARPDHTSQKVDLKTMTVVGQTAEEKAAANAPTSAEVMSARASELRLYDWTDTAPHLTPAARAGWQAYRQALRDITKHGHAIAMVKAWPQRPDGASAIEHLHQRLPS